jgi:hypothetical protein
MNFVMSALLWSAPVPSVAATPAAPSARRAPIAARVRRRGEEDLFAPLRFCWLTPSPAWRVVRRPDARAGVRRVRPTCGVIRSSRAAATTRLARARSRGWVGKSRSSAMRSNVAATSPNSRPTRSVRFALLREREECLGIRHGRSPLLRWLGRRAPRMQNVTARRYLRSQARGGGPAATARLTSFGSRRRPGRRGQARTLPRVPWMGRPSRLPGCP